MAEKAGMKGKYTNHSGKQSCATTLFQNGVDKQLIMGRTGHQSNAVRAYKRPSQTQQRHISELLDPPKKAVKMEPEETSVKPPYPPVNNMINLTRISREPLRLSAYLTVRWISLDIPISDSEMCIVNIYNCDLIIFSFF